MAGRSEDLAELERIEAAFRRAAHRALHGTREERSGRFLPRKPVDSADDGRKEPVAAPGKCEPRHRSRG
jgi:hypothetical protein